MRSIFIMLISSLVYSLSFISVCNAEISIEDPSHILEKSDEFLGLPQFSQSFSLNDKATFTNYTSNCEYGCEDGSCWNMCEIQERSTLSQVYTCSEDNVTYGNDEGTLYLELKKEQFESMKGNMARYVSSHLDDHFRLPGHLLLNKFTLGKYKDELSTNGKEYDIITLWGEYVLDNGSGKFDVIISLAKNVPAIAQVIRLRVNDQTIYRLKGIN